MKPIGGMYVRFPTLSDGTLVAISESESPPIDPRTIADDLAKDAYDRMEAPQRAMIYLLLTREDRLNVQRAENERYHYWSKARVP